ncbi:pyrroline-5-carboxylate reductase [Sinorhizobium glycinis]|uniref:Pyrroline-5-carboxylate reductase n=1 Tax=Sinorhizobium glycinis TaxID=1472378 RepID=A0A178Y756_9HYPH|nr:pyrroline-5-carboxylate reductase dimerization domain-containing protein [Sinorhizobium glycinis]OAP43002.1 pyrroline-5-carboxylate reductase [Sinorhizobium glycinis]
MGDTLMVGVIGANGWLGRAITQSILDARLASSEDLTLSYRTARPTRFPDAHWTKDNQELADRSDVIIVSVRPDDWPSLTVTASGKLVISVMAGIRLSQLAERLQTGRAVRALPNAAAEVGRSYTPWVAAADVDDRDRSIVRGIFEACGSTDEISSEADIDYLTGLSGSGPAFPALLANAMMKDAMERGIPSAIARRAVAAMLIGSGRLLELREECPAGTVETFLNYRGTTAAAIEAMRAAGFDAAVASGLAAALTKAVRMGQSS